MGVRWDRSERPRGKGGEGRGGGGEGGLFDRGMEEEGRVLRRWHRCWEVLSVHRYAGAESEDLGYTKDHILDVGCSIPPSLVAICFAHLLIS